MAAVFDAGGLGVDQIFSHDRSRDRMSPIALFSWASSACGLQAGGHSSKRMHLVIKATITGIAPLRTCAVGATVCSTYSGTIASSNLRS